MEIFPKFCEFSQTLSPMKGKKQKMEIFGEIQGKLRKISEKFTKFGEKSKISAKFQQIQIFLDQIMVFFVTFKAVLGLKKGQNRKKFRKFLTFLTFEAGIFIKRVIFYYKSALSFVKKRSEHGIQHKIYSRGQDEQA